MKKLLSVILLVTVLLTMTLTACSNEPEVTPNPDPTEEAKPQGADLSALSLEEIMTKIYENKSSELPLGNIPVDLADPDALAAFTGLSDASLVKEALASESMMGSQAYSLVLVRVNDAAKAEEVAQTMLENIDPVKWICVQADDIDAAIGFYGSIHGNVYVGFFTNISDDWQSLSPGGPNFFGGGINGPGEFGMRFCGFG